ncbi:Zinc-finger homeodomain protein 9 [Bienertia sinuspersici]
MDMTVAASRTAGGGAGVGPGLGLVPPTKSPEAESETPPRIQPTKPISFSNGVLKRHAPPSQVVYKECLKNHAATLGGHALDGCGEFMPSPSATSADPTSLKCAACGCHRNFHRREPEDSLVNSHTNVNANTTHVIEYQPHHRHHPLPPPPSAANRAESPPPISSTFAPHMLLALSTSVATANNENAAANTTPLVANNGAHYHNSHHNQQYHHHHHQQNSRKRFRTKFSQEQKEKMHEFAEKVGWKMQKTNEEMVNSFCNEIGVERGVFKVWMHNNKNTFGKRSTTATTTTASGSANNHNNNGDGHLHVRSASRDLPINGDDLNENGNNSNSSISINDQPHHHIHHHHHQQHYNNNGKSNESTAPTNASSSSS